MSKEPSAKMIQKFEKMQQYERIAWQNGYKILAGVDEAGRGPLAGPVVVAACILDPARPVYGLDDSKKLTPASRNRLYEEIKERSIAWRVEMSDAATIDRMNILQATCAAMRSAINGLAINPDLVLVDAVKLKGTVQPVWSIVRGDALSISIAAASILAKVTRDRLMEEYDQRFSGYGFSQHKGYGTKAHYEAIYQLGPSPIHRISFLRSVGAELARRGIVLPESEEKEGQDPDDRQMKIGEEWI